MAKETLVGLDVELGEKVLGALDAAGYQVTVALWLLTEEFGEWRLVLASPLYDKAGPKEAYLQLHAALSSNHPELLHQVSISLKGNRSALIRALRSIFGKTASVAGMRLGDHVIGDVWIDDAYVYRIR
ncbi:MAG: hypothetical protein HY238_00140 [Acidobacteria bacterium]|nr:hypothetical protein [Acidobacteriota bacterium]